MAPGQERRLEQSLLREEVLALERAHRRVFAFQHLATGGREQRLELMGKLLHRLRPHSFAWEMSSCEGEGRSTSEREAAPAPVS